MRESQFRLGGPGGALKSTKTYPWMVMPPAEPSIGLGMHKLLAQRPCRKQLPTTLGDRQRAVFDNP